MVQPQYDNTQREPVISLATDRGEGGFATLIGVLLVGALASALAVSLLFSGVSGTKTSLTLERSFEAGAITGACAEVALQKIHDNLSYSGTGSALVGSDSCTYTVVVGAGPYQTITATATVADVVRKMKVEIATLSPTITLSSWLEVADF